MKPMLSMTLPAQSLALAKYPFALVGGASATLAFAPFGWWPFMLVSMAIALWLLPSSRPFLTGWSFGSGFFLAGISWVYSSMKVVDTPTPLAVAMTTLFCVAVGLLFGLQFKLHHWLFNRLKQVKEDSGQHMHFALFPVTWVLFEWLRSWLFTGLPWLYAGTAVTDTWIAGWLPLGGVFATSALLAIAVALAGWAWAGPSVLRSVFVALFAAGVLLGGLGLQQLTWVKAADNPLAVVALQGNIDQRTKWNLENILPTYELYRDFTLEHTDADLILWPEAAITTFTSQAIPFVDELNQIGQDSQTAILSGILTDVRDEDGRFRVWNSVIGLGQAQGEFHKTRMVPFGEYVPLESLIRGLIDFFNLPMSSISPGPSQQEAITWQHQGETLVVGTAICYEIAYPNLVRQRATDSQVLITVSNDSWFGGSIGPHQHLQIARVRAIANGRPVIRATQDGMSAIVDHQGNVQALAEKFVQSAIRAEVYPTTGQTPYNRFGHSWLMLLGLLMLSYAWWRGRPTG